MKIWIALGLGFLWLPAAPAQPLPELRGQLRVINRTPQPVRLVVAPQALLPRSLFWELPVKEGLTQDLRLEWEGQPLTLAPGDVWAAFSLNGNLHWGPKLVGRGGPLSWDERKRLWTLSLSLPAYKSTGDLTPLDMPRLGSLRVGNPTPLPLKVLLTRTDGSHQVWTLAPRQGQSEGQALTNLAVAEGDLLLILATDGSRRYWGPNILGFTPAPFWDGKRRIWSTLVRP